MTGLRPPRMRDQLRVVISHAPPLVFSAGFDAAIHFLEYGVPALATLYGALWMLRGFGVIG